MACACGKDSCGCQTPQLVYLQDEQGQAHAFLISERLQVDQTKYVLLMAEDDAEQVALLRVIEDPDGQERYQNIESEAEWKQLQATLFQSH